MADADNNLIVGLHKNHLLKQGTFIKMGVGLKHKTTEFTAYCQIYVT